jgi:hypothetical protein
MGREVMDGSARFMGLSKGPGAFEGNINRTSHAIAAAADFGIRVYPTRH